MRSFFARTTLAAAAFVGAAVFAGVSFAATNLFQDVTLPPPTLISNVPIGQVTNTTPPPAGAGAIYSNIDHFTGFGVTNGGSATTTTGVLGTRLLGDEIGRAHV